MACQVLRKSINELKSYRETYPKEIDRRTDKWETGELKLGTHFVRLFT